MQISLKDPEIHHLAKAIAQVTGETVPDVVRHALRERYARLERQSDKAGVEELLAIADQVAAQVKRPYDDHATLLYDENGLPT